MLESGPTNILNSNLRRPAGREVVGEEKDISFIWDGIFIRTGLCCFADKAPFMVLGEGTIRY